MMSTHSTISSPTPMNSLVKLSVIHFNSRNLNANFSYIEQYSKRLSKPFKAIVISEIWGKIHPAFEALLFLSYVNNLLQMSKTTLFL